MQEVFLALKIEPYSHHLLNSFVGTVAGFDIFTSSQYVKFHAPSGTSVYLEAVKNGIKGGNGCTATLFGYLIDQP